MEQHCSVDCTGNDDFPTFPKKRPTSQDIHKFSKKISRKLSFHSTLLPEFLQFSVEWFAFRKFNVRGGGIRDKPKERLRWRLTVSGISGNFSRKFLYHLPLFQNFRKFWLNEKRPRSPPASLTIQGQVTKDTTVKWSIVEATKPLDALEQ